MEPAEFPAAVEQTARRFGMDLSRPLAMVSGGPDSVALLRALVELGTQPVVLHVDHNLRGEEARFDAEFVRRLCEEFGLDGEVRRVELGESNLQDEARKERYRIAEALAKSGDNSSITTGHTADDVAETVLMNLARGAGLRGLSGIPPVRGKIARPLIERRRREVLSYLEHLGQPYRTDLSNLTPKYARNRVRLEVLPVLEELYPGAARNISRAASLLREDSAALEELAARSVRKWGEEVLVSLGELSLPALGSYAVRRAYQNLRPDAPPLGFTVVEAVLRLTKTGEGTRTLDLPGKVVVAVRSPKELAFYQKVEPFEGEEDLIVGEFGFAGWRVGVREVSKLDIQDAGQPEVAYLDAALGPYRVRMAREGDTIRPLGLGGTKKIHKAMMDRGVPKDIRPRTPVIVDRRGRVAWIFAGELDEEFKIRAGTKKALRVEVESSSLP
jgi:tRNA(Ile)-lysidine synthase